MDEVPPSVGRFLPAFVRERCVAQPQAAAGYESWPLSGALLFVDIVGFTGRVERLVARGPEGVELANELLENTIGRLVGELSGGGGDVVLFAGDALFVFWPRDDAEDSLAPAIGRASASALRALERLDAQPPEQRPQLRFSLGAGEFVAHRVGGHQDRWHCLLSGPVLDQVGRVHALARNDVLLASPEAWELAGSALVGESPTRGARRVRGSRIDVLAGLSPPMRARVNAACLRHVSAAVTAQMGQIESRWLAEFRRPSTLFARLPGLLREGRLDGELAQRATLSMQRIVDELGGTTLQFVIDDKGPVLIVVFGLAERVHEDDPARAALAGLRLVRELGALGVECGVGVATGRVFCGLIGNEQRSDYTVIGQTMNLAARLMQLAEPGPLCDELTQELAEGRVEFAPRGAVRVKGLEAPVPHYAAVAARREAPVLDADRGEPSGLIGRARELDILGGQLEVLRREHQGGLIVVVGEAGIGKSCLVRELMARARLAAVLPLIAAAGTIESTPYARWRPVLHRLLEGRADEPVVSAGDQALLRVFLGELPQSGPEFDDAERAYRTREAIARVVVEAARHQPILLCIEDAHWMDSLSWSLAARLAQRAREPGVALMLVMTTRELEDNAPADALARLAQAGMLRLPLGPLALDDRIRVAQAAIGVSSLPPEIGGWISTHSGGNPFFCRELAVAAVESGRVRITDGRAELSDEPARPGVDALLPDTLQGLIASRLDRLGSGEQLSLRIAAVIGARFSGEALLALHPLDAPAVEADLRRLMARGFLDRQSDSDEQYYAFNHALVRDAAYDSLPYKRRRELHARLAAWLQQRFASEPVPNASSLAHHWECAEDWPAAFEARLRAGEAALQAYANREAVEHYAAAASLRSRVAALRAHPRASHPELGLARAHHRMGDERASRRNIEDALRAAGEVLPTSSAARVLAILRELFWRLLPRVLRVRSLLRPAPRVQAAVRAYDLLPEILYYDNDPLALALATLRFVRLAEAEREPSAERARAWGWLALLRSGFGRSRTIDVNLDHALSEVRSVGDPAVDAWLRLARGSLLAQFGDWAESERWLVDARTRCAEMGDRTRWWNVTSGLGHVYSYRGELPAGAAVMAEALQANRDTDNPVFLCWGLSGHAEILYRMGQDADRPEVLRMLRAARAALARRPDPSADLFSRGVLAAALHREGHADEALALARETVENVLARAPVVWVQVGSYLGLIEVLRNAARHPDSESLGLELLQRLERSLAAFARLIPVGRPALALARGEIDILRGRRRQARRVLGAGLAEAQRLGLPTEQGRLHMVLSEVLEPGEAVQELGHAISVFERLGAHYCQRLARERWAHVVGISPSLL